jgi:hypothetical protein
VDIRSDVFGYGVPINDGVAEWYLNFAHFDLFCAYGGSLLAQDELQVAEHPALGSLREALLIRGVNFETVEDNKPTPVLIRNVERRCSIDTEATPQRPFGLYGNAFARASFSDISAAAIPLKPTTFTNIIAMEAPTEGYGDYTAGEIGFILSTAYTGFSAALHESHTFLGAKEVVIHTGFWGCGAYGGNRVLMVALQIIAANLSSLDRLVFHTVDSCGAEDVNRALDFLKNEVRYSPIMPMADLIDQIVAYGFEWGESDGN